MTRRVCCLIGLVTLFSVLSLRAEDQFREFKSTTGKPIRAYIREFDAKRKLVTLKLASGRIKKFPISVFSEEDQAYILDWPNVNAFMSNEKLRIYLDEPRLVSHWIKETWGHAFGREEKKRMLTRRFKRMVYPIRLVNQSRVAMTNVTVKICVYSKHERIDHAIEEEVVDLKVTRKKFTLELIKQKENIKFESPSVVLITKELDQSIDNKRNLDYLQGACRRQDAWLEGLRVRFCWTTPGGQELMREVYYPRDLALEEYEWVEPTGNEVEEEYDETNELGPGKQEYYEDNENEDEDDGG